MNLVERWFAELTTKWPGAALITASLPDPCSGGLGADWNEHPRPFIWHKTADQIFDNLTGYLNRIPNSGH